MSKQVRIGIVIPPMNYFEGVCELLASVVTKHITTVYIQPQWRNRVTLAAAWNQGAKRAFAEGCDFALVCNDDIMFAPECIDAMVDEWYRLQDEKVVMVTPNNMFLAFPNKYDILSYRLPEDHVATVADHPNFSCFLISPDYFEKVGYFDELYNPAWYEDNDSHRRAELAGVREITTTAAPMIHIGGVSTSLMPPQEARSDASRAHYIEKWGGLPGAESFVHPYNDPTKTVKDW